MATHGLECKVTRNVFLSMFRNLDGQRHGWNYLRGVEFAIDVEGYTESWRDGVYLECWGRHILLEGLVNGGVLWHPLPTTQDKLTPNKPPTPTTLSREPLTVFPHHHGFYHWPPSIQWIWLYHGCGRPWIYEGGNFRIMQQDNHSRTDRHHPAHLALQTLQPSRQGNIRQRPQFASHAFRELGWLLGIKLNMGTAHHPQTDGAMEWSNQEIKAYLSIFCSNNPKTWNSLHLNSPITLSLMLQERSPPTSYN